MVAGRIIALLFIAVMVTSTVISATYARYTGEFSGRDTALVAKWNMGARGEDDAPGLFYNKGFTFDLFDAREIKPMDYGEKSFTFRGGGSDVAIAYDVKMNVADLMELTTGQAKATIAKEEGREVWAPFIFKITAQVSSGAGAAPAVFSPYEEASPYYGTGWFRPKDVATDQEGYFSVFEGTPVFPAGSNDEVTITVYWQWNTSFYINDTNVAAVTSRGGVTPDPSTAADGQYLPYYQAAYDEYYGEGGLLDRYEAAMNAVEDYLAEHGSPREDGSWPPHETVCTLTDARHYEAYESIGDPAAQQAYLGAHGGTLDAAGSITWTPHTVYCAEDHFAAYNALVTAADNALNACRTSLLAAYDDYDTFAVNALRAKQPLKIMFRVTGEQVLPRQGAGRLE